MVGLQPAAAQMNHHPSKLELRRFKAYLPNKKRIQLE
jgi:hypothetical protein